MPPKKSKFIVELLPDLQYNKNIKTRRIAIVARDNTHLLTLDDIKRHYNRILNEDKYNPGDVSIKVQDTFGITFTAKGYRDDAITFDDDYANDRVQKPDKFDKAVKAIFFVTLKE